MSTMFEVANCDLKHGLQGLQNTFTTWRTEVQAQAMAGSDQVPSLLAERAQSECARPMRAVEGSLGHSPKER